MEIKKLEAAIEAILFTMGNSVELAQIADAIQQDKETTRKILQNMMDRYQQEDRGIQIIELEQSYQMCSKKEYYECLIRLAMHPKKPALTDVMLETEELPSVDPVRLEDFKAEAEEEIQLRLDV